MSTKPSKFTTEVVDLLRAVKTPQPTENGSVWITKYAIRPGNTFDRIVYQQALVSEGKEPQWDKEQTFIQCFVNRETGNIHYSASFNAPAKWKDGPAVEFFAGEYVLYAKFVKAGGSGYKGSRAIWEGKQSPVEAVEPIVSTTDDYDLGYAEGYTAAMAQVKQDVAKILAGMP